MTNCDRSRRPIPYAIERPSNFPSNREIYPFYIYIYPLSPSLEGGGSTSAGNLRLCAAKSLFWGEEGFLSLSLSVSLAMRNYSGTGEEIGEMPQQGCALSRSFFARKYRRERGRDLVVELIWFVLMSPGDLSPLFRITFAWILLG